MIKSTELRIGNYVVDTEDGNIMQVTCGGQIDNSNLMNPIPLTEEWLLKFGFGKDKDNTFVINSYLYWLDTGFIQIALEYTPLANITCKYVHELQNLYFALTSEKLTFKP